MTDRRTGKANIQSGEVLALEIIEFRIVLHRQQDRAAIFKTDRQALLLKFHGGRIDPATAASLTTLYRLIQNGLGYRSIEWHPGLYRFHSSISTLSGASTSPSRVLLPSSS